MELTPQEIQLFRHNGFIRFPTQLSSAPQAGRLEPILVFDRGFARAQYVIKFLKDREI